MLETKHLSVDYHAPGGVVKALRGVDISISEGEAVGVVGESGCGKSTLALSIMRLVDPPGTVSGSVLLKDIDLMGMDERGLQDVRGKSISMIFQDPFSSLNPVLSIGEQIIETLKYHERVTQHAASKRAAELLAQVRIKDPAGTLCMFPHQLSGGMKQRVMIAMAVASRPKLLIADEPTTSLDVTIQREIMELLLDLRKRSGMAMILITHNIALASEFSDRFYIMYAGEVMEQGDRKIISLPRNPYTYMLLKCLSMDHKKGESLKTIPGKPPLMTEEVRGCSFSARCRFSTDDCNKTRPKLERLSGTHYSRCIRVKEIDFNE